MAMGGRREEGSLLIKMDPGQSLAQPGPINIIPRLIPGTTSTFGYLQYGPEDSTLFIINCLREDGAGVGGLRVRETRCVIDMLIRKVAGVFRLTPPRSWGDEGSTDLL